VLITDELLESSAHAELFLWNKANGRRQKAEGKWQKAEGKWYKGLSDVVTFIFDSNFCQFKGGHFFFLGTN